LRFNEMKMTIVRLQTLTLMLALMTTPSFARGQTHQAQSSTSTATQNTPFVALGSPGSSRIGTAISFPVASTLSSEAELGYRRGEGRIHALSTNVNLLYLLPRLGRVTPYIVAGAGLEEYGTPLRTPASSQIFTQPKLTLAINAGGGIKVPVDEQWTLRTDGRWFNAVGTGGSEHWRLYQGASFAVGK
jgi:hypothetical protein